MSQGLDRVRHVARQRKKERFTALLHHVTPNLLRTAFFALRRQAAPGVDGLTWQAYEADLDRRIEGLHERVHRGAYRALPARRGVIPKADGSQRPLAIVALEDKIVQRATAAVLNAIYEEDFLGFSYGFRPGRGTHDALDALCVGIGRKKVSFVLDADIRSFFDEIDQQWSIRFLEHRISDKRIIRLVQVGTFPRATSTPTWAFRFAPYGTTRPLPRLLIRSGLGAQQRFRCHARAPELAQTDGPLPLAQGRSK